MTNGSLMKVENIAECPPPWSILQYFGHAISDYLVLKTDNGLFEGGLLHRFYCISKLFAVSSY